MPTVILVDVSLSMCRPSSTRPTNNDPGKVAKAPSIKQLAASGVRSLCDYFMQNNQLEQVALVEYSRYNAIRLDFSRDYEKIKQSTFKLELYDRTNIVSAIREVLNMKLDDSTLNIIVVTDGQAYNSDMHLNGEECDYDIDYEFNDLPLKELEGQIHPDCRIQVVCITSPRDPSLKLSLPFYKKLVSKVDILTIDCPVITGSNVKGFKRSAIWLPESTTLDFTEEQFDNMFKGIAELNYKPYSAMLSCGHLCSKVILSPKPGDCMVEPLKNEFDDLKNHDLSMNQTETFVSTLNKTRLFELSGEIIICGFMPSSEIASPAITSRHIIFPVLCGTTSETAKAEQIFTQNPNAYENYMQKCTLDQELNTQPEPMTKESHTSRSKHSSHKSDLHLDEDITKMPSFCVLLHNCLKQESMVAVCIVGKNEETNEEWFGIIHPHTDAKKRSSMILSLLGPGSNPILWLPNFKTLGSSMLNADLPPAILERIASGSGSSGSGGRASSRSYSSNNVIWLDPESVQADVQKIVRHAKRTPDKAPHFYKELNRIRRAAISYGFFDVLHGLASILEREKRIMMSDVSKPANMEIIRHIDHVITCLRVELTEDSYDTNIVPPVA